MGQEHMLVYKAQHGLVHAQCNIPLWALGRDVYSHRCEDITPAGSSRSAHGPWASEMWAHVHQSSEGAACLHQVTKQKLLQALVRLCSDHHCILPSSWVLMAAHGCHNVQAMHNHIFCHAWLAKPQTAMLAGLGSLWWIWCCCSW